MDGGKPKSKSLRAVIECDVCFEIMTESKALNCLHHFCVTCIKNMMETNQQGLRGVNCPTCRRFTLEANIQSSFMMNNLLDIYKAQKGDKLCSKHPEHRIEYNCRLCNTPGCSVCMLKDHNGHTSESIEEALDTMVINTKAHVNEVMMHQEKIKEKINDLEKSIEQCVSNSNMTKEAIQDHSSIIIEKVTEDCANLMELIDAKAKEKLEELGIMKHDLEKQLASQEKLLLWTNKVINMTKGPGPLCELQEGLYERVKNCARETELKDIKTNTDVFLPHFSPKNPVFECNQIGEVRFSKHSITTDGSKIEKEEKKEQLKTIKAKSCKMILPSFLGIIFPIFLAILAHSRGRKPFPSFIEPNISFQHLTENNLKYVGNFKLNRKCSSIAYINKTLWCPCFELNGEIDVYKTNGQLLHTMHIDSIHRPKSVHTQTDQHVLVAAANGLHRISTDGKAAHQLFEGEFCDVSVKKDVIAAFECVKNGKAKLHVLNNTDSLIEHTNVIIDYPNINGRILIAVDHIYIGFNDNIIQYTLRGERLHRYGHYGLTGPGQFSRPLLCSRDAQQSILVADHYNQRFQVLDRKGNFRVVVPPKWRRHNKWPRDVAMTPFGHVYILYDKSLSKSYHIDKFGYTLY